MMNNILIIGGAGYIGSHITYELCEQGYNVTVLDNLSTGYIENVDKRAKFVKHSFTNKSVVKKILKEIDCVIHLAALKAAGESMNIPLLYSEQNIIDSISLINECIRSKVKNFIFSSTAAVYGHPQYLPIDEKHVLNPINYYGFTKLIIENQLLWYSKLKNINIAILRYFNAAGYNAEGKIFMKEKNPDNLLPIVMEVAIGQRKKIEIYGNDYNTSDGTCLRDYIHVSDLANAHVKSIEYLQNNKKPLVVNLATGQCSSVLEVIRMAQKICGKKIKYEFTNRRDGDVSKLYSVSKYAKEKLNWHPEYSSIENIIDSMWKIYKK